MPRLHTLRRVPAKLRRATVFALALLVSACSAHKDSVQAPMTEDGSYYGGEDYAIGGSTGVGMAERSKSADYDFKSDLEEESRDEAPSAPPMEPAPDPEATDSRTTTVNPTPDPSQPAPESAERKVVYTASMQVAVYELEESMAFAEALPERYDGWVQSRQENQITLRIPAGRLGEAMTELAALGVLLGKTLQASDVTAEYTDLESRLIVLEQMEERLVALLAKANTVEESLKIRQELERVRIDLERSRARMRQLSELISFSTLTVYLSQRGAISPGIGTNDPFPWVDELGVEATEYR